MCCDVCWDGMLVWGSSLGAWWGCMGEAVCTSRESCPPGGPINTAQGHGQGATFTVSYWMGFGFCFCCLQDEISIEGLLCDIPCYCLEIHLWRRKRPSPNNTRFWQISIYRGNLELLSSHFLWKCDSVRVALNMSPRHIFVSDWYLQKSSLTS